MRQTTRTTALIAFLALAACKGKKSGEPAGGTAAATGDGGAAVAAAPDAAAAPACDLAGDYRVRFRSNGADGWFIRFTVAAGSPVTAKLTAPIIMLGYEPGPIDVVADTAACKLTLTKTTDDEGEVKLVATVDPATGAVTGELTRAKAKSADEGKVAVTGVRGANTPPKGRECIAPGIYALSWDSSTPWKNADPDDDRKCKDVVDEHMLDTFVRVEWLGSELVVDQVEKDEEPGKSLVYKDDFGDEKISTSSGCDVTLSIGGERQEFEGTLTFAADGTVTGKATTAKTQVIVPVDDGEGEDIWDCVSTGLPIDGKKVSP